MKRGFLKNATKAALKEPESNTLDTVRDPRRPTIVNLAAQSKEVGGLNRAPVSLDGLDEILQKNPVTMKEMDGNRLDHPDDGWIITTQPAQPLSVTAADEPDGWSECYVTGRAKRAIVNTPGFPSRLPRPSKGPNSWRVESSPGKGMGLFADCDLKAGDLILAERPLIVIPAMMEPTVPITQYTTPEQIRQLSLLQQEKMMEMVVGRLTEENQEAYKELYNCHTQDGSGPLFGIHRTNAFEVSDYFEPHRPGYPEQCRYYSGAFKILSRVNHSCRPNGHRDWDSPTFSLHLRANRDIKKGEEITISYLEDLLVPTADRQFQLRSYGFQCACEACSNPVSSDANRKKIQEFGKPFFMALPVGGSQPPSLQDMLINPTLKDIKLMEEEGLQGIKAYGDYASRLMNGYAQLGDRKEQMKWKRASVAHKLVMSGARNTANREAEKAQLMQQQMLQKVMDEMPLQMGRLGL